MYNDISRCPPFNIDGWVANMRMKCSTIHIVEEGSEIRQQRSAHQRVAQKPTPMNHACGIWSYIDASTIRTDTSTAERRGMGEMMKATPSTVRVEKKCVFLMWISRFFAH